MNAADIVVRDIYGHREMRAVERLQKEVWGLPDLDVVPLTQIVAAKASGGEVIGAFYREALAGFAYGFVGYEEGSVTHHSHMLAVRPEFRSFNIGYRLKLAQRERVLEKGIDRMTWTFDPLQSLNAHFNFNKLGVVSNRYFVNFYGEDAASFLHRNGTDRLWVTWPLTSRRVRERLDGTAAEIDTAGAGRLIEVGKEWEPISRALEYNEESGRIVIEIPGNINELEGRDPTTAALWREATRNAITEAFAAGYHIDGFERADRGGQKIGQYLLSPEELNLQQ